MALTHKKAAATEEAAAWTRVGFRRRLPMIAMMQATDARLAHHSGHIGLPPFLRVPGGRIFVQDVMNTILVVVPRMYSRTSRRRWDSFSTITWSSSSRRQLPTQRSATPI